MRTRSKVARFLAFTGIVVVVQYVTKAWYEAEETRWSWNLCVYDKAFVADRVCHFKNVCFNWTSKEMYYYRPSWAETLPIWTPSIVGMESRLEDYSKFPAKYVELRKNTPQNKHFSPTIRYEPFPKEPFQDPDLAVLYDSFWPENFGHALGDDFFPIWRLQRRFGLLTDNVQLLIHSLACDSWKVQRGCFNHDRLSKLISKHAQKVIGRDTVSSELQCYRNVLMGTALQGMSFDKEGMMDLYTDYLEEKMGLEKRRLPKKHLIVILEKKGRRRVLNNDELMEHLKKNFAVDIKVVDVAAMELEEQARLMRKATVVISPCGGLSFATVFMNPGMSVIFLGYWNTRSNESWQMEDFIYSQHSKRKVWYYPTHKDEILLDEAGIKAGNITDVHLAYRNHGNIRIDTKKLTKLVASGLLAVDAFLGWSTNWLLSDTF